MLVAAAVVGGWLLFRELATLFVTLVITAIVTIPLEAGATRLERAGVPRAIGALVGLMLGLAAMGGVLLVLIPPFVEELQRFIDAVPVIYESLRSRVADLTGRPPVEVGERVSEFLQGYVDDPMRLLGPAASVGLGIAGVLATIVVMLMTAYYAAVRPAPIVEAFLSVFPAARRARAADALSEIRASWIGWLHGVAVDMVVTFVILYVGLLAVGLEYAVVFATVSALLVVVPYLGAIAGGIPPVLFALADTPTKALIVLGIYVVAQQVEGNVIVPLVMSRTMHLHPVAVIVGVVVVGRLIGIIGLLVAVPIISALLIVIRTAWVEPMRRAEASATAEDDTGERRGPRIAMGG